MGCSRKVIINKQYKKDDGSCALYLQVIIDRKKKPFPLKLDWSLKHFNQESGMCEPRYNEDPDVDDYNMIITDALTKANEIFKYYRLSKKRLTMDRFIREWNNELSKENFVKYMEQKAKVRYKEREIEYSTYQAHLKVIVKLKAWREEILFMDLDHNWAGEFDSFLKKHIKSRNKDTTNTRWNHHKTIKAYLHLAEKKDQMFFENPYDYFSISQVKGTWKPIYEEDLNKLYQYYKKDGIDRFEKLVLRRFLFGSFTGLRKSDLYRVEDKWLSGGIIRFVPYKNRRFGKILELPLQGIALDMFNDALAEKGRGKLFNDLEEQTSNRILKKIAKTLEIDVNLHHHVARHTFITLYLKNGGTLDMAQAYAGHHDIKQTMRYNHIDEERRNESIKVMNGIIKAS